MRGIAEGVTESMNIDLFTSVLATPGIVVRGIDVNVSRRTMPVWLKPRATSLRKQKPINEEAGVGAESKDHAVKRVEGTSSIRIRICYTDVYPPGRPASMKEFAKPCTTRICQAFVFRFLRSKPSMGFLSKFPAIRQPPALTNPHIPALKMAWQEALTAQSTALEDQFQALTASMSRCSQEANAIQA